MKPKARILIIDDDAGLAGSMKKELDAEGYDAAFVLRGDAGLAAARQAAFDLVLTDLKLPGLSGLDLIDQLRAAQPKLPIILMTAYGTSEAAIEATRRGACKYLPKPFEINDLLALVARLVDGGGSAPALLDLGAVDTAPLGIVGQSRAMQALYQEIGWAAQGPVNVLIRGETGTGKELVARAIHAHSRHADQPFVAVNCTAIPEALLESELFGHERGAFTGALSRRLGRFEQAGEGTLFLDEIGDLSPEAQAKLLRVIQERCFARVGGNEAIPVKARILAATHRNLDVPINKQQVREDLFYRLSTFIVRVPPLRERLEDIPDLVRHILARFRAEAGVAAPSIQVAAVDFLRCQRWPGNVRELENMVRQALLLAGNHPIALAHVQAAHQSAQRALPVPDQTIARYVGGLLQARQGKIGSAHDRMVENLERELFAQAIELARGNRAQAARWAGVSRNTLHQKLAQFGLESATNGQSTLAEHKT